MLQKRGEVLRLRKYGDEWLLTHKAKGKITRHKSRVETETRIADGRKLERILESLGYEPAFRYEKFRAEWYDGKGHVVLDETPIGSFGEIEGPARWIDRTAKLSKYRPDAYITQSYVELFFAWKRRPEAGPGNDIRGRPQFHKLKIALNNVLHPGKRLPSNAQSSPSSNAATLDFCLGRRVCQGGVEISFSERP